MSAGGFCVRPMGKVGDQLRRAREAKGLSIADVEKTTRIRARFLQAMEEDRWNDLPGPVQARGFLRNYAALLGLDGDALVALRETPPPAQPAILPQPQPQPAAPINRASEPLAPAAESSLPEQSDSPTWLSPDMIAGSVALVLFVIVAALAAQTYVVPLVSQLMALPPEPTIAIATRPQTAFTPTTAVTPTPTFPVNESGVIQLGLAALEHVWVRITTDGITAFEGLLAPGKSLTWEAREQLIVETGDGAALNFAINGKTMGPLGARHQITIRAWSPRGEVVPPPTSTPAPPTPTPEPAPTLVPLPTAAP